MGQPSTLPASVADVEAILEDDGKPASDRISQLGYLLRHLTSRKLIPDPKLAEDLFLQCQNQLLDIPGHAEHFGNEIRRRRTAGLADGKKFTAYHGYAVPAYQILAELPSPETVRVMSRFLDDTQEPGAPGERIAPPSTYALNSLRTFIQDPPTDNPWHLQPWLDWRAEIEAGKRTFRMKGSKAEYNFEGKVLGNTHGATDRTPKRTDTASGNSMQLGDSSRSNPARRKTRENPPVVAIVVAALLLIGSAGWLLVSRRVRRARRQL